jgi:calcineurin-like phosphoesterase family protein
MRLRGRGAVLRGVHCHRLMQVLPHGRWPLQATRLAFTAVMAALLSLSACDSGTLLTPTMTPPGGGGNSEVLILAGDIGDCGTPGAERTGRLIDGIPGTVVALGDNAYPSGNHLEYGRCYHPFWGRHVDRTRPVPGNHDYETAGAIPYYLYFGENAGPQGLGYYSYTRAGWLILALNSEIDMGENSSQLIWLRGELAASPARCVMAYWHRPPFSSGPNGNNVDTRTLWRTLYNAGADVVFAGHEHWYEKFAPQNADGAPDFSRGMREFVVGTGGGTLTPVGARAAPNSEVRGSDWGVLKVTLRVSSYEWEFIPAAGGSFRDSGSTPCH